MSWVIIRTYFINSSFHNYVFQNYALKILIRIVAICIILNFEKQIISYFKKSEITFGDVQI